MFKRDISLEVIKKQYSDEFSKFITIDDFEVHYKDEGEGMPLVLLHSMNTSLHDWEEWTNSLKGNHRIIRLDLPGFGLSGFDQYFDFRLDTYIYFIKKFTTKIGLQNFNFGGVGWGADIAWHYTTLHPYLVDQLILVNPVDYSEYKLPFYQRMSQHWFGKSFFRWFGSKKIVEKRIDKWFSDAKSLSEQQINRYQNLLLKEGNRKAYIAVNNAFHRNRYNRLINIKTPTLLLCSTALGKSPFEKELPNVTTIYYKETKNYPMIELPAKTAKDVNDFLNR